MPGITNFVHRSSLSFNILRGDAASESRPKSSSSVDFSNSDNSSHSSNTSNPRKRRARAV